MNKSLKIFVIGGENESQSDPLGWQDFGKRLGVILGNTEHQVVLCSSHPTSLDYFVLEGISVSEGRQQEQKVIAHHPFNQSMRDGWSSLVKKLSINTPEYKSHKTPEYINNEGEEDADLRQKAYLLCQLQALDDSDVIMVVGGKLSGSAIITISLALERELPILPFPFFGGAGRYAHDQSQSKLLNFFGRQTTELFNYPNELDSVLPKMLQKIKKKRLKVFISYAWARAEVTDFIEAVLRRRDDIELFRDEIDIKFGSDIQKTIREEIIENCDVFLALWCLDYTQSPYCYDELEVWLERRERENLYLLLLDETRAVWPQLRSNTDKQKFSSKTYDGFDETTGKISREKIDIALHSLLKRHVNV